MNKELFDILEEIDKICDSALYYNNDTKVHKYENALYAIKGNIDTYKALSRQINR